MRYDNDQRVVGFQEMAEDSVLSESLTALGEALRPVALKLGSDVQDAMDYEDAYQQAKRSSRRIWALVLGAIGLGWMIGAGE